MQSHGLGDYLKKSGSRVESITFSQASGGWSDMAANEVSTNKSF